MKIYIVITLITISLILFFMHINVKKRKSTFFNSYHQDDPVDWENKINYDTDDYWTDKIVVDWSNYMMGDANDDKLYINNDLTFEEHVDIIDAMREKSNKYIATLKRGN